jgi:cytochrome d ubiquinol oxidase subunit II
MTELATPLAALSEGPVLGLPLTELWFGLVFFILGTFLFLDGFDFGIGALFATREDAEERETLLAVIGPFWDGNEVWLVVFGGALFAVFPAVYANLFSRHYLLMFAILGALILRGLAPEMYEQRHDETWQKWWGRAFVVGSVSSPFFLGLFVGNWLFGVDTVVSLGSLLVGLAVVALTVVDGAAFLRVKTRGRIQQEVRAQGELAQGAYLVLAVAALVAGGASSPAIAAALTAPPALALLGVTVVLAGANVAAGRRDRHYLAFATVAGQVYALAALVAVSMYPLADAAVGLTVDTAIVSILPLNLTTIAASFLLPLVFTYFVVLYSTFSGPVESGESYS